MKINNQFSSVLFAALLGATISFSSCKDDDVPPPPPKTNTITDVVVGNSSFSVLKEAVVKAKLDGALKGTGPFTVFAPDNAAFALASPPINSAFVAGASETALSDLLLYHTLDGKILAAGVPAGPNAKVTTKGGDSIFVTKNANGVFVNGIKVAVADIPADNGVIHQLSKALNKPAGNIVATAQAAGLDSLVKAVLRVNTALPNVGLVNLLSNSTLTVFAPTNAAFTQLLGVLGVNNIDLIPINQLAAVLTLHVAQGRAFSSDLATGSLTMLGGTTTVSLASGATIKGNGNGVNAANITATNIMCRNGVVHLIDRVLLP
jgi:uncharacterized surface protein with fasciclin (FAS1) repeats